MKKLMLISILILMLCRVGLGADIYVDKDFAGGSNDGSISNPWTTIQLALDNQTAGNTDTIHIKAAAADYPAPATWDVTNDASVLTLQPYTAPDNDVTLVAAGFSGMFLSGMTTGSVTFNDLKIRSSGVATSNIFRIDASAEVNVTFNRCGFGNAADDNDIRAFLTTAVAGTPTREITFDTCTFVNISQITGGTSDLGKIEVTDCTYTITDVTTPSGNIFDLRQQNLNIIINNSEFNDARTTGGSFLKFLDTTEDVTLVLAKITGNTINKSVGGGIIMSNTEVGTGQVFLENNVITINASANSGSSIHVGGDTTNVGDFPYTKIIGNTVKYTGASISHCYLIGQGVLGSYVEGNYAEGGNAQYVIKNSGCLMENNIGIGPGTLITKGSKQPIIRNNTFIADSGSCFQPSNNTAAVPTEFNGITNNIFMLTGTATYFIAADSGDVVGPGGHWIDNNCWYTDSASYIGFMAVAGANPADFGAMQTYWLTWSPVQFPLNMANGIDVNPRFASFPTDLTPTNSALKLGDNTWIGGVQPAAPGISGYRGRYR